jgi:hypothetical protein
MHRLRALGLGGRVLLALAVGGAVFGIAAVVQAAVPSSDGLIHACYGNSSQPVGVRGDVRVRINWPAEGCPNGFTPFSWNATGPTGPTGATGPTGPAGLNGSGVAGWAVVNSDASLARGKNVASTGHIATGAYEVIFTGNVSACEYNAVQGNAGAGNPAQGFIVVAARAGNPNGVFIETRDVSNALADRPFHLSVDC